MEDTKTKGFLFNSIIKCLGVFIWIVLNTTILNSQSQITLTNATRAKIVENICIQLEENYVFPDTAKSMCLRLRNQLNSGAYDKITNPVAFSDALSIDLYSIYNDRHLLVQFIQVDTSERNQITASTNTNYPPFYREKQANSGLNKIEVLPGNIGYIKIDRFWADTLYGKETVKAALEFVSNSNALIIDVRNCGGGSQETVNLICGYFLIAQCI